MDPKDKAQEKEKRYTEYVPVPTGFACVNCGSIWWLEEIKTYISGGGEKVASHTGFLFEAHYGGRMMRCPECP